MRSTYYQFDRPVFLTLPIDDLEGLSPWMKASGKQRLENLLSVCFDLITIFCKIDMSCLAFTKLVLGSDDDVWSRGLSRMKEFLCNDNFLSLECYSFWNIIFNADNTKWQSVLYRSTFFKWSVDIMPLMQSSTYWEYVGDVVDDDKWRAMLFNMQNLDIHEFKFAFSNDAFVANLASTHTWCRVERRWKELLVRPCRDEYLYWSDFWELIGTDNNSVWNTYRITLAL